MQYSENSLAMLQVSVVFPVRNEEQRIGRCLESLIDFDEVLLLDGNSTDKTREIASRFRNVRIVKQYETDEPNIVIKDFSEVRNKGLALARHEWILSGDADLIVTKEVVQEVIGILQKPEYLIYDIPRKYLLDGEQIIDFASNYTNRSQNQFFLFNKRLNPQYVGRVHAGIAYDKKRIQRGRLNNHILNLYVEPPAVLKAKMHRFIQVETEALKHQDLSFQWWVGLLWHQMLRILLQLWRIGIAQVKGNILKLGATLPWCYERLKIFYRWNLVWMMTRLYWHSLRRHYSDSARTSGCS